jgi:hypothetical protein
MEGFDHILNWKLMQGSHPFPGQDGGTCINEAAIVAAGFPYRRVRSIDSMPDCFSRPICRLAMRLNDWASDDERQQLLPFVTRLACADTPEIERKRAAYIDARMTYYLSIRQGLDILEGALAIGRQADGLAQEDVKSRMDGVRRSADTPKPIPDTSVFLKIKSWLTPKKKTEAVN